ncbi:MAG: class I SAM-dependent methyltransferase [Bryobacterales bacterium]|nr:class I SAM-dependent methyltransferase [Bryobacterales bacterium]
MSIFGNHQQAVMRRALLGAVAAATPAFGQRGRRGTSAEAENEALSAPKDDAERRILGVIEEMASGGGTYLSVPISDGKMLRILTESCMAKRVVEVGTSTGYSGLFFALALSRTGGRLTTHELNEGRAATARANFAKAGVSQLVTLVQGDAHETTKNVKGPVDVIFLDADKEGYVHYLKTLLPALRPGGLLLAHNTGMVPDYLSAVRADPALDTVIYSGGGGLSVTLKKL